MAHSKETEEAVTVGPEQALWWWKSYYKRPPLSEQNSRYLEESSEARSSVYCQLKISTAGGADLCCEERKLRLHIEI